MSDWTFKPRAAFAAVLALTTLLGAAGTAQAALHARDGGMVYDDVNNITWLADMNYNAANGADGLMNWPAAAAWAASLTYGGFDDWRLPTLNAGDTNCSHSFNPGGGFGQQYYGYNCTSGELSHLFVVDLGNKAGESVLNQTGDTGDVQRANLALFSNVQSYSYWSETSYVPDEYSIWNFNSNYGYQDHTVFSAYYFAVAVRPGDVAAVPESQTYALLLVGLGMVAVAARGRSR